MLPELNLDTEDFFEITADAVSHIHTIYPEWTDFNYHDPGITLIELAAWLKEITQYKLNLFTDSRLFGFLDLMCIQRGHKQPAAAKIYIDSMEQITLPKGSRFYAGDIVFETTKKRLLLDIAITHCFAAEGGKAECIMLGSLRERRIIREYLFTRQPKKGTAAYIAFSKPLPSAQVIYLGFNLYEEKEWRRNRLEPETPFMPLAEYEMEYYTEGKWKKINIFLDQTAGFLFDGNISFILAEEMEKTTIQDMEGYYIRICLKDAEYEMPPILTGINLNMIELVQQETTAEYHDISVVNQQDSSDDIICINLDTALSVYGNDMVFFHTGTCFMAAEFQKKVNYPEKSAAYRIPLQKQTADSIRIVSFLGGSDDFLCLGKADGMPNECFYLEDGRACFDAFAIMIKDQNGVYTMWEKKETFFHSSSEDRHYVLEEEEQAVYFGDGIHGMLPQGSIYMISYARTFGHGGNVKAGAIKPSKDIEDTVYVYQDEPARDGKDLERLLDTFERLYRRLLEEKVFVNESQYEMAIQNMHGQLIESCKAIRKKNLQNEMIFVVKPKTMGNLIRCGKRFLGNILSYLEKHRLLGTKLTILYPKVLNILVYADIILDPYFNDAEKAVRKSLEDFFSENEKNIGGILYYSDIYGMFDGLPAVSGIKSLSISCTDLNIEKNHFGDLLVAEDQVTRLLEFKLKASYAEAGHGL